jgi:hypothetical protein
MREKRVHDEVFRQQVRRALGESPHGRRFFPVAVARGQHDADLLALPEHVDDLQTIQNADGTFVFMVGFSGVSVSPDTVA